MLPERDCPELSAVLLVSLMLGSLLQSFSRERLCFVNQKSAVRV